MVKNIEQLVNHVEGLSINRETDAGSDTIVREEHEKESRRIDELEKQNVFDVRLEIVASLEEASNEAEMGDETSPVTEESMSAKLLEIQGFDEDDDFLPVKKSLVGRMRNWIFKTKSGRATLGAASAFRIFQSFGGVDQANEFAADTFGSQEASHEMRSQDLSIPSFGSETEKADQDKKNEADILMTQLLMAISERNSGSTHDQVAKTCVEEIVNTSEGKIKMLDAEKTLHFYGSQLSGPQGGYSKLDILYDMVADIGLRSTDTSKAIGKIVRTDITHSPAGFSGFSSVEYNGDFEELASKRSYDEVAPAYDDIYNGEVRLLDSMMTAVDFDNLDSEKRAELLPYLQQSGSAFANLNMEALTLAVHITDSGSRSFESILGTEGGNSELQEYQENIEKLERTLEEFDGYLIDEGLLAIGDTGFKEVSEDMEDKLDDYIATQLELKGETLGSLRGSDQFTDAAKLLRSDIVSDEKGLDNAIAQR